MINGRVKRIIFNWFYTHDTGEEYNIYTVGEDGVSEIKEYYPAGEGDLYCADIIFKDGARIRTFNPNEILYFKEGGNENRH